MVKARYSNQQGFNSRQNCMLGTTNGEHQKLIGVKTMSLFQVQSMIVLLGCCKCFRIRITSYKEDYMMYCPTNKVVKSIYSDALA